MDNHVKKVLSGVGFYGTLAACLAVVGICGWILLSGGQEAPVPVIPVTPQPSGGSGTVLPGRSSEPSASEALMPEYIPREADPAEESFSSAPAPAEPAPAAPAVSDDPPDDTPAAAQSPDLVVEPLRGEVLAAFSMEELIFSPTLGDWRTHNGVDIAARAGTTVLAACAGTVLAVEDDALMGTTVVLAHSGGYQTTYSNLQAKPTVAAGDTVSAGQIIGAVGATAAAEAGAPHLHFAVTLNGKAVDPHDFLEG